jgi:hypothetical protein
MVFVCLNVSKLRRGLGSGEYLEALYWNGRITEVTERRTPCWLLLFGTCSNLWGSL